MTERRWVVNASPLIFLAQINALANPGREAASASLLRAPLPPRLDFVTPASAATS